MAAFANCLGDISSGLIFLRSRKLLAALISACATFFIAAAPFIAAIAVFTAFVVAVEGVGAAFGLFEEEVKNTVEQWLPYIIINEIEVLTDDGNTSKIYVQVKYSITIESFKENTVLVAFDSVT